MNLRYVIRQLGLLAIVLGVTVLLVAGISALMWMHRSPRDWYSEVALLATAVIGMSVGIVTLLTTRGVSTYLGRREALLLVAASWFLGAALAALPYYLWVKLDPTMTAKHPFDSYASCYFEAMSGLTTTGATVLGDIQAVPRGLLLWRALTHWLGGLGIVVLFVAVLPSLGVGGKRLFQIEATGVRKEGVRPRIGETARALWMIYLGITIAAAVSMRLTGSMGWFDAVCHAFSVVSTGGLSTRDASIAYYDSVALNIVCMIFMLLAGVNFALLYQIVQGRFRNAMKDTELWIYLGLKLAVIVVVSVNLIGFPIKTTTGLEVDGTVAQAVNHGAFQTIALHTGTGFVTADYDSWPFVSRSLLIGLMFIGGCAGSTAGGIKVIRFWIALRVVARELEKMFRPNVIRPLKVGKGTVDSDVALSAVTFFLAFIILFAAGAMMIGLCEPAGKIDFMTAMSASIASLCNVGPGLYGVGATQNYGWFTDASKFVLSALMALGRLEVFTIFVVFMPGFWRSE